MRTHLLISVCAVLAWVAILPAHAQTATITIGDRLEPDRLEVAAGTTVTWRNSDSERHRVRSTSGPDELDSGNLERGESWTFTFRVAGTYRYEDARDDDNTAYHGTVTVVNGSASGGGSSSGGTSGGGTSGGSSSGSGGAGTPGNAEVSLVDRSFSPPSIEVPAGTTVRWTNESDRDHNVTAEDGSFQSSTLGTGDQFTHTFATPGTYGYLCTLHSGMRATVVVSGGGGQASSSTPSSRSTQSSASGGSSTTSSSDAAPQASAAREAQTASVEVQDFAFSPPSVSVATGDTVEWANVGQAPHTVTADDGSFDSATMDAGGTFSHQFDEPGTYRYTCRFHPDMVAQVEVSDGGSGSGGEAGNASPAPAARDGPATGGSATDAAQDGAQADAESSDPTAAATESAPIGDGRVPLALMIALAAIAVLVPASVLIGAWRVARAMRPSTLP